MSEQTAPIPLTVIGGYLGSGKTTLVNRLVKRFDADTCVYIVNDFGALNIDSAIIRMNGGKTIQLENGCICCSIGDSLIATLLDIVRMTPRPRRVVIEASGIADPQKIAAVARLSKSFTLDGVVVVADAGRIQSLASDEGVAQMIATQLKAGQLIVLNKRDLVDAPTLDNTIAWLNSIAPSAEVITAQNMIFPDKYLFGWSETQSSQAISDAPGNDDNHAMKSFRVTLGKSVAEEELISLVNSLPESVHRIKGFIRLSDYADEVCEIQYAGPGTLAVERLSKTNIPSPLGLVFIGPKSMPDSNMVSRFFNDRQTDAAHWVE